jgi:hypothetical protein
MAIAVFFFSAEGEEGEGGQRKLGCALKKMHNHVRNWMRVLTCMLASRPFAVILIPNHNPLSPLSLDPLCHLWHRALECIKVRCRIDFSILVRGSNQSVLANVFEVTLIFANANREKK